MRSTITRSSLILVLAAILVVVSGLPAALLPSCTVLVGLEEATTINVEGDALTVHNPGLSTTLISPGIQAAEQILPLIERAPKADQARAGRVYRLHLAPGTDMARIVQDLSVQPGIVYAEPDSRMDSTTMPGDALHADQWGLVQIDAPAAWDVVTGTADVIIADVGSGLDTSHPDLSSQLWVNAGEVAGNGLDDDGNGYIDDVHGWNMLDGNADLSDSTGHSTMVAGIMVAAPNNEMGVAGVCWGCRLMVVKVTPPDGQALYSDIAAGIAYAAQNGADVINISLRGRRNSATLWSAIAAASKTAVVVSSAGNDGDDAPVYPAAYDTSLSVTGTNRDGSKPGEANYGSWVDVSAPGRDILTTSAGGGYQSRSGTSLATPFVSGLAGLLRSQHPEWSPATVRAQIIDTADGIDGLNPGLEGQMGSGRINAARAVTAEVPLLDG